MKREAVGCTKMKKLCRRLDLRQWQAVGILESLWFLAAKEAPRGDIGRLSNEDIALGLDYEGDADELIDALLDGWLDKSEHHRLIVHDWHEHSDDAIDLRLARTGRLYANGNVPRMNRLSKKEREVICSSHGWNQDFLAQKATKSHEKAPPEPEPEPLPEPEPEPVKKQTPKASPSAFVVPEWVPKHSWEAWMEVRKRKRAANTHRALELAVKRLGELDAIGESPRAVLDQSTFRSWTGLFPVAAEFKGQSNGKGKYLGKGEHNRRLAEELNAEDQNGISPGGDLPGNDPGPGYDHALFRAFGKRAP